MAIENNKPTVIASQPSSEPSLRGGTTKQSHNAKESNKQIASSLAMTDRKVPKLRFKEFEGEWDSDNMNNITSYVDYRGRGPEKSDQGIFLVTAKNIKKGYIDYENSKEYVPIKNYSIVMSKGLPKVGDILFTTEAPLGNIAQVDNPNIALAQRVIKLRGKECIDNTYLLHYMLAPIYQKLINRKAIGTTVQGISGKELRRTKVSFPNLPEQQKIANFLTAVDTKIQQLNTKKEHLEQYKKGVMQQLFTQQLRFKPDTSQPSLRGGTTKQSATNENQTQFPDWEEKKLGEVCEKIQDGNYGASYPKADEFVEIGIPFLTSKALGTGGSIISDKIDFIPLEKHKELKKAHLKLNDVLFTNRGANVGAIAFVDESIAHGNIGPQLTLLRVNQDVIESEFLLHSMNSFGVRKQIASQDSGSAMNFFGIGATSKFKLKIPHPKEQQKIANYLSAIDLKIEAVNTQISNTQAFKKGLLQQMFV
ncbi:restriction endonuclease subunit S [Psychroserpens sp. NJDZ02]|uniref:restriction endonuclease subunit S n=1 Tax=Psychroserpens sp. NJDZ02 TaxID=2570561 RepID=UPI0010A824DC|nr:restriction endonuclease subunit S [Psychroserpens sp. NJDZ02]QCE43329.1 hypothetical protein E9099_18530 [Psychroserpens sp. NJDZ02]